MEIIVFLSIVIAVVAVLTSIVLVRRVKKQIAEMTDVLVDVKNGNGNRRILSATNELTAPLAYEINEIVVSYESRLSTVRQTEETNRQLMTSLSHDVRTPLTTLIGYLDAAHKGLVTGKDRDDYIETARRKAHDLKEYIDVLFDWFKLNSNEFALEIQSVEAAELTRNILIDWIPIFEDKQVDYDIDINLVRSEFLPKAVASEILADDKRPLEEQLASLGFFDLRYNCPTNGCIILFGGNPGRYFPGAYVQYVRFKGVDRAGEIINEHKFGNNLCHDLIKIDAFVETSVSQKRPIPISVLREETVANYPYWATRELLMNAIMHRDYETNAPIQFYEYDDRIEIQNPGGLYGKVSPENFPNVSDYRNPFIAEAMKILGYVNRFSRGVYRVQKELTENGNEKAEFDFSFVTAFRVIEKASKRYYDAGFGAERNPQETHKKPTRNTPKYSGKDHLRNPKESGNLRQGIGSVIRTYLE